MIISNPDELNLYLPHFVQPAKGERAIFDKIAAYIIEADKWIQRIVCTEESIERHFRGDTKLMSSMRTAIASQALYAALSALDVVMTPNGIGVVSTDSIAPASRERTESMRVDLIRARDAAILDAVERIITNPDYRTMRVSEEWHRSLFPPSDPIFTDPKSSTFSLKEYYLKSVDFSGIEMEIANKTLSAPILYRLRYAATTYETDRAEMELLDFVRTIVSRISKHGGSIISSESLEVVRMMREDPELYNIWSNTPQAKLFQLPGFVNEKRSGGFFF